MKKLLIFIAIVFVGCNIHPYEDPYKYCGAEVVGFRNAGNNYSIYLRYSQEIIGPIYIIKHDYMVLQSGDIISCDSTQIDTTISKPIPIIL